MATLTVFYADWEMECCGTPFSVGDEVRWGVDARKADDEERSAWADAVTERGELLSVSNHGDVPAAGDRTVGRVRAIHVVTLGYLESAPGSRTYEPVPGERGLRPVRTCPKWFSHEPEGPFEPRGGRGYRRSEAGVLVELDVADADGRDGDGRDGDGRDGNGRAGNGRAGNG